MHLSRSLLAAASMLALTVGSAGAANMTQTLNGRSLGLEHLRANVVIKVDPAVQGYQVQIDGDDDRTALISMGNEKDNVAFIRMADENGSHTYQNNDMRLHVTITVPANTDLGIDGFVGTVTAGDLGNLALDADGSGALTFGNVKNAAIDNSGSSDLVLGNVDGKLAVETSGSGSVKVGTAGPTSISISGSGNADIASVNGPLGLEIDGSSDVKIGSINGPTSIDISGSGSVTIKGGTANPLQVDASGSGEIYFNGTAVNPQIDASGSGDVCIAKVEGSIQLSGAHVKIDPNACVRG